MLNITTCFVETLRRYIKNTSLKYQRNNIATFGEALMWQIHIISVIGKTECYEFLAILQEILTMF